MILPQALTSPLLQHLFSVAHIFAVSTWWGSHVWAALDTWPAGGPARKRTLLLLWRVTCACLGLAVFSLVVGLEQDLLSGHPLSLLNAWLLQLFHCVNFLQLPRAAAAAFLCSLLSVGWHMYGWWGVYIEVQPYPGQHSH